MAGKKYGLGEQYKSLGGAMNVQKASVGLLIKGMRVASKAFKGKGVKNKFIDRIGGGKTKSASTLKTSAKDKVKKGVLKTHNAIKDAVTSKAGIGATGSAVGYELGKVKKKMYGGAMKKMKIGGAAIKGKGAVVGGSGLQDEKLKPGKKYKVKKASLGVLMDAGMRNKKVMGAGALGLLSMLAKKKK